jgi:hypothetical protein
MMFFERTSLGLFFRPITHSCQNPGDATVTATHRWNDTHAELAVKGYELAWISIKAFAGTNVAVGQTLDVGAYGWYGSREYDLRGASMDFPAWTSADQTIAVIDLPYSSATQQVRGVAPGQTTITATFAGMSASLDVTVE